MAEPAHGEKLGVESIRSLIQIMRSARAYSLVLVIVAVCVMAASACRRDDESSPPPNTPPPSDPIRIRGTERIQWNQAGPSVAQVRQYQYRLYIDENSQVLNGVQCNDTQGSAGFDCSVVLPGVPGGTHTLSVSAAANGVEGPRSSPLPVIVDTTRQIPGETLAVSGEHLPTTVCSDAVLSTCYETRALATVDDPISSVAALPDGRVVFVEGAARIRVIAGGELLAEPALVAGTDERLIAVLPDVRFGETHAISVAAIKAGENGRRDLSITQYREVANQLAQGAATVDLRIGPDEPALVDRDGSGMIYVALAAQLLRFSSTGTVPWDSGQMSPVLASVPFEPTALAIDAVNGLAWIAGRKESDGVLGSISTRAPARAAAQLTLASGPRSATAPAESPQLVSIAFVGGSAGAGRTVFAVDSTGVLRQGTSTQSLSVASLGPLSAAAGPMASVWPGIDNSVIVVYRDATSWSIASLHPLSR